MTHQSSRTSAGTAKSRAFQNTLWGRVMAAGMMDSPQSQQAVEELCKLYRYPIYIFVRRLEPDQQRALDLTQGFFEYLLERKLFGKADPERGRFRSFLIGILKNYLRGEHDKEMALRRGGGLEIVSLDAEVAEGCYAHEQSTNLTPEKLMDRRWAMVVLDQAMSRLENEYNRSGMKELFVELQPYLSGAGDGSFAELGARVGRSEGAARVLVFRHRERFRQLIRAVIADTVADPEQVEIELRHLQAALREN